MDSFVKQGVDMHAASRDSTQRVKLAAPAPGAAAKKKRKKAKAAVPSDDGAAKAVALLNRTQLEAVLRAGWQHPQPAAIAAGSAMQVEFQPAADVSVGVWGALMDEPALVIEIFASLPTLDKLLVTNAVCKTFRRLADVYKNKANSRLWQTVVFTAMDDFAGKDFAGKVMARSPCLRWMDERTKSPCLLWRRGGENRSYAPPAGEERRRGRRPGGERSRSRG